MRADELSGTLGTVVVALDDAPEEARLELDLAVARVDGEAGAATSAGAVAELEELHTLARSAHDRLRGLQLPD